MMNGTTTARQTTKFDNIVYVLLSICAVLYLWVIWNANHRKAPPRPTVPDATAELSAAWQDGFNNGERAIMAATMFVITNKDETLNNNQRGREIIFSYRTSDPYVHRIELPITNHTAR